MADVSEKSKLRAKLQEYEGRIEHMYLDTKGFVTIGVGHLITDVAEAKKLNFVTIKDSKKATGEQVEDDFDSVKKQVKGLVASSYKKHIKLKLSASDIDSLTNKHIEVFEGELKSIYGGAAFNDYPSEVRLALFDMIFNLGMTKLKNQYVKFNNHIKEKKWQAAANESKRIGISDLRNDYVKGLLEKAAKSSSETSEKKSGAAP